MAKTYEKWSEQYFDAEQHTEKEKKGILGMAATAIETRQIAEVIMEAVWIGEGGEEDAALAHDVLVKLGIDKLYLSELMVQHQEFKDVVVPILVELASAEDVGFEDLVRVVVAVSHVADAEQVQPLIEKAAKLAASFEDWETVNIYAQVGSEIERLAKQKMEELM